ncbi:hypothetical protein B0T20DRAFT_467543 [Sordaria brevicollis]|uniref:Uncharacterized protein n=1 Tax=Sordaria brevicollis TaxID=83679 RepID=A0AAE0PIZ1_SORBR|nr:hypothetical protein B0T20DRAFT_467543 [Sordaria brevicollis]
MSSASTLIKNDLRSRTEHPDLISLLISIERSAYTSARTHQNQTDGRPRKRLKILWNRVFKKRAVASQQQEQPVISANGHLVITYPDSGMRRTHVSSMWKNMSSVLGDQSIGLVEFIDKENRYGVMIKGISVVNVSGAEGQRNFQTITTTKPEDTRALKRIIGCGTTEGLVVIIPTVFTKTEWAMACMARCRPELGSVTPSPVPVPGPGVVGTVMTL